MPTPTFGPVPACSRCRGTGSKPYRSMHPMCSDCYGTGCAGTTLPDLEEQARLGRELAEQARLERELAAAVE